MTVWKVKKKPAKPATKDLRLVYSPFPKRPYRVQIWADGRLNKYEDFPTKPVALDWAELNYKGVKLTDFTMVKPEAVK